MHKRKNTPLGVDYICPNCKKRVGGLTVYSLKALVKHWKENKTDPYPEVRYGELCSKCKSNKQ